MAHIAVQDFAFNRHRSWSAAREHRLSRSKMGVTGGVLRGSSVPRSAAVLAVLDQPPCLHAAKRRR